MKRKVVIEIRGGTLAGLYTNDADIDMHVVDWDNIDAGDTSSAHLTADLLNDMPAETAQRINFR
ncbi:MAG: hypothetical protein GX174_03685 [Lentisphaerae bacterium]|jgi:hypothetical protein|nr:hypothetical protein [Lentisphaerota bacterium]